MKPDQTPTSSFFTWPVLLLVFLVIALAINLLLTNQITTELSRSRASVSGSPLPPVNTTLGQQFQLRLGQAANLTDIGMQVVYLSPLYDCHSWRECTDDTARVRVVLNGQTQDLNVVMAQPQNVFGYKLFAASLVAYANPDFSASLPAFFSVVEISPNGKVNPSYISLIPPPSVPKITILESEDQRVVGKPLHFTFESQAVDANRRFCYEINWRDDSAPIPREIQPPATLFDLTQLPGTNATFYCFNKSRVQVTHTFTKSGLFNIRARAGSPGAPGISSDWGNLALTVHGSNSDPVVCNDSKTPVDVSLDTASPPAREIHPTEEIEFTRVKLHASTTQWVSELYLKFQVQSNLYRFAKDFHDVTVLDVNGNKLGNVRTGVLADDNTNPLELGNGTVDTAHIYTTSFEIAVKIIPIKIEAGQDVVLRIHGWVAGGVGQAVDNNQWRFGINQATCRFGPDLLKLNHDTTVYGNIQTIKLAPILGGNLQQCQGTNCRPCPWGQVCDATYPSCSGLYVYNVQQRRYVSGCEQTPVPTVTSTPYCSPSIDCAVPPAGCFYQRSDSCGCGTLVCSTPTVTPTALINIKPSTGCSFWQSLLRLCSNSTPTTK